MISDVDFVHRLRITYQDETEHVHVRQRRIQSFTPNMIPEAVKCGSGDAGICQGRDTYMSIGP